jgi:hypothetical protein
MFCLWNSVIESNEIETFIALLALRPLDQYWRIIHLLRPLDQYWRIIHLAIGNDDRMLIN